MKSDYWIKRKYNTNTLTWEEALKNLQYSRKNNLQIKINPPGFFVCHEGDKIKNLQPVMKDLKCVSAHLYINVFSQEENSGKHKDEMDVWFWQCSYGSFQNSLRYTLNLVLRFQGRLRK